MIKFLCSFLFSELTEEEKWEFGGERSTNCDTVTDWLTGCFGGWPSLRRVLFCGSRVNFRDEIPWKVFYWIEIGLSKREGRKSRDWARASEKWVRFFSVRICGSCSRGSGTTETRTERAPRISQLICGLSCRSCSSCRAEAEFQRRSRGVNERVEFRGGKNETEGDYFHLFDTDTGFIWRGGDDSYFLCWRSQSDGNGLFGGDVDEERWRELSDHMVDNLDNIVDC